MLQRANSRPFFRSVHARASVIKETRLWLDACVQIFVSAFASKASSHDAITTHVKLKVSRNSNQGDASVSQSHLQSQHAHAHFSAGGDTKISVRNAGRQNVDVQFCNGNVRALACRQHDATGHFVDSDAKGFESSACKPYAKTHSSDVDARVTQSKACGQMQSLDSCSPSIWDSPSDLVPHDVSNASGETLSPHMSFQALVIQTQKKAQKALSDLQQKVELLESEQFSLSDAAILVKRRGFQSCSFELLSTVLQVLKEIFPSAKVVHDIVVGSSTILLQRAELVQQKLKLLLEFQVEENVVSRLCCRGKVLSVSVESLQKKLLFFKDSGLTVEAINMMFFKGPLILSFSIENSIQPAVDFLASTGLTRESIWNLGQHCPDIFYMSLDNNLIKKYQYIRQLGFSAQDFPRVCRCVSRLPIKNIEEHLQYLKDRGFTDDDVLSMVKSHPSIISCSLENIKGKLDFLIFEQKRDMREIVKEPVCLTFSLRSRMVPRFNFLNGLGDTKVYLLSAILNPSESMFMKRFGKQKERRLSAVG